MSNKSEINKFTNMLSAKEFPKKKKLLLLK